MSARVSEYLQQGVIRPRVRERLEHVTLVGIEVRELDHVLMSLLRMLAHLCVRSAIFTVDF